MTRAAAIKAAAAKGGVAPKEGAALGCSAPVAACAVAVVAVAGLLRYQREPPVAQPSPADQYEDEALDLLQGVLGFSGEGGERSFKGFSKPEYWDERYKKSSKPYDWYSSWEKIGPLVAEHMPPLDGAILNVGCGSSRLPRELHDVGYTNVTSIDYSPAIIERMRQTHPDLGQSFLLMDMTQLAFANESFDLLVDKGALDALYTGAHDKVLEAVPEFFRVLRPGGRYFSITFGEASTRTELRGAPWASFETLVLARHPQAHYIHVAKKA